MNGYANLKKNVAEYQKKGLTYSADGNQFKLNRTNDFFISVNNPKITKDGAKNVLNDIANEIQKIIKTNPRGQANEKKIVLDLYKHVAQVFAPLLESDNEEPGLETQISVDQQPDTTDMSELESNESAAQNRTISKRTENTYTKSNA